jgi:hypothetical protein
MPEDPKNWRPIIIVVTGIPQGRSNLVHMADWLGSRRGLVNIRHVIVGPFDQMRRRRRMAENNLARFIRENNLIAVSNVDILQDRVNDIRTILRSQGFGTFVANTVILDWSERDEMNPGEFEKLCRGIMLADKTLLLLKVDPDRRFGRRKRIGVWVEMDSPHQAMTLILGFLISQDPDWASASIEAHILCGGLTDERDYYRTESFLAQSRIPMEVEFHPDLARTDIFSQPEEIARRSKYSDLLIAPINLDPQDPEHLGLSMARAASAIEKLPSALLVRGKAPVDIAES